MDKLIESLFAQIEIIVVGALTVVIWRIALALSTSAERVAGECTEQISRFWTSTNLKSESVLLIRALLIGGLVYYAGIFTTVISYRFVAPIRYEVEERVFVPAVPEDKCSENVSDNLRIDYLYLPLEFWHAPGKSDVSYLKAEARIDVAKHERIKGILDDEHRIERVLRGSLWLSSCAAVLCSLHIARTLLWRHVETIRRERAKYAWILLASVTVYVSASWSYPAVEYEFNNFVCMTAYSVSK